MTTLQQRDSPWTEFSISISRPLTLTQSISNPYNAVSLRLTEIRLHVCIVCDLNIQDAFLFNVAIAMDSRFVWRYNLLQKTCFLTCSTRVVTCAISVYVLLYVWDNWISPRSICTCITWYLVGFACNFWQHFVHFQQFWPDCEPTGYFKTVFTWFSKFCYVTCKESLKWNAVAIMPASKYNLKKKKFPQSSLCN